MKMLCLRQFEKSREAYFVSTKCTLFLSNNTFIVCCPKSKISPYTKLIQAGSYYETLTVLVGEFFKGCNCQYFIVTIS